ncbi:MAG: hypothetical protein ABI237_18170 [Ginsengibacter sp.]
MRKNAIINDRADLILNNYRETVATDSVKARNYIKRLDYRNNFYLLKCIAQTYLDESRFEDESNKMRKKINFRKWRTAEKYIIKAFKINPDNAEVLYTMGKIRKLNKQDDVATYCFEKIIDTEIKTIATDKYGRGIPFAKELVNDSRFELYRLYYETNPNLSKNYLTMYKKGLEKGVDTIFKPLNKFLLK